MLRGKPFQPGNPGGPGRKPKPVDEDELLRARARERLRSDAVGSRLMHEATACGAFLAIREALDKRGGLSVVQVANLEFWQRQFESWLGVHE